MSPSARIMTYANRRIFAGQMRNVRGFIVVAQTTGTPGDPDVFIVGLAIPLPKLFCFEAPAMQPAVHRAPAGFRSRACESFTVKSNRADERPGRIHTN